MAARGDGPDRHLRRARADRRRPDRGGRRPLRRPRAGARRGDGGEDRRDPARFRAALQLRRGGGARGEPQAGDGPRGRDRARPGRHRARAGRPGRRARGRRAARPAARAAADVAGGARDRADAGACSRGRRRCAATRCGCSASPSPRSPRACARSRREGVDLARGGDHHLPAPRRDRDRRALPRRGAATADAVRAGLARAPRAPSVQPRRRDDRRAGRRSCSPGTGSAWPSRAAAACWRRGSPNVPGASDYFAGGVVAYSNEAKAELLGVDPDLIEAHGAVSPEVAEAMAHRRAGALRRRRRGRDHRHRRARRRHRGEAGRLRLLRRPPRRRAPRSPATRSSPAAARTSANARRWSGCTCCASC